ncbi:helix-turn-helix domain-containing protein [Bradyrhizobium guangdongense]|uniref:AraC family transcriptional regulator n=1 Tax=Bradyrhizobium guangdongense TaxID=1325090 RepID=A0A410VA29_9BRAD|nr:helix-turn-helix domain-containing protein [Bradyrhizobium guangdongense]QAU40477.1 AraC family transcriptional regulator [Bradyrhizobium guangdongense]QOZ61539.1 AraC family transcriptional regulator [Bradyrhizobium guangdongense]GGI22410.1 AraC family transcriptional regulator [Bradyrhizobium guangdongense]
MPLNRLKPSRVLTIERFSDYAEFRANEVLGLGTSTPLRPREFSLTRAILPLQSGVFVLQRAFARRFEAEMGTDTGIGLVVPLTFHSITNGVEIDSSTIGVVRGKAPVVSIEHQPNTYFMLRFNSDMRHRGWTDFDTGLATVRPQHDPMARLRAAFLEMFSLASGCDDPRQFEALHRPIQETLFACLDAALVPAGSLATRPGSFDRHRKLIARLDEVVELFGSQPLYSDDLATALGVSVRTLQTATQVVHGVSLHHYLRLKRLWAVRVLLMTGGGGLTVKAAALANGFWHLGDFSVGYKRAFGEMPSETLARGRGSFYRS